MAQSDSQKDSLFRIRLAAVSLALLLVAATALLVERVREQGVLADPTRTGFEGVVTDITTGLPLAHVVVQAAEFSAVTGRDGRYRLELPAGTWAVHAGVKDYIGMTHVRQRVGDGRLEQRDFEMFPDSPTDEQMAVLERKWPLYAPDAPTGAGLGDVREAWALVTNLPRTIRVLMTDGIVVEMGLDEYVKGVVPREVYPNWPEEALKAQAVAARCFAATQTKFRGQGADVDTTTATQVWSSTHFDTTDQAVEATHGVAARYDGRIIEAFFHNHCDGHTRNSEDVWGGYLPYARSVSCPYTEKPWLSGHGVGMCQWGARELALQGKAYDQILEHYYTGIAVVVPEPPSLALGEVSPQDGNTYTSFRFQVTYTDGDGDQPLEAVVDIDGVSKLLNWAEGAVQSGALYVLTTTLPPGEHEYSFHFDDGYGQRVRWPANGVASGPVVIEAPKGFPTPTPSPTPAIGQTQGATWSQTTLEDWSAGVFSGTEATTVGNGALTIAEDSLKGVYTSTVYSAPLDFMAIGGTWLADLPAGVTMTLSVRASQDAQKWSTWQAFALEDAERGVDAAPYGALVFQNGRYVQYRVELARASVRLSPRVEGLSLVFVDSRFGPSAAEAQSRAVARDVGPSNGPLIVSRAEWAANESWMTWEKEYRPVRTFVIHHTVTSSGGADPASVVRAIYYYHAVTQGWGDIGYNYVIDDRGHIYEGRTGGEIVGADGQLNHVVGGHAKNYNWGSIGIAVLGDYTSRAPSAAAINSLVELIAWKGTRHFVDPLAQGFFIDKTLPKVMGHRDCSDYTTCPGNGFYALLPSIRQRVMERMRQIPPNGELQSPPHGAYLRGVQEVTFRGSAAVTSSTVLLDGHAMATVYVNPGSWKWNTTQGGDGWHEVKLVSRTAIGLTHEDTVVVSVDNTPPSGGLSAPAFTNQRQITLGTPAQGANRMQVSLGWSWEGEDLRHSAGTGRAVDDPDALDGQALRGQAGVDHGGPWYGQYLCDLPEWRSYWAYFRLKVDANTLAQPVVKLDAVDDEGRRVYATQVLEGTDFAQANRYLDIPLGFAYKTREGTCEVPGAEDGLEFRTWFLGSEDLWLDRVDLFAEPEAHAPSLGVTLASGEGLREVAVRYLDEAGNPSPIYTATIVLDVTPPFWLGGGGLGYGLVRDTFAGLDIHSGSYSLSNDGETWGAWRTATIDGAQGTTTAVVISGEMDGAKYIKFRASDRAGNTSSSPPYALPGAATSTPSITPTVFWRYLRLPLVLRDYDASKRPTPLATASSTLTPAPTDTTTLTVEPSPTDTPTPTGIVAVTGTPTLLPTATGTPTPTGSATPASSVTPSPTATVVETSTWTPTWTPTSEPIVYASIVITGTVYDSDLGVTEPISDAEATISIAALSEQFRATTNISGTYHAEFHVPAFPAGVMANVAVRHPRYADGFAAVRLNEGVLGATQARHVDIAMVRLAETTPTVTPTPSATPFTVIYVQGQVHVAETEPRQPISNAQVSIYLPNTALRSATSDTQGWYQVRFEVVGEYSDQRVDAVAVKAGYFAGLSQGRIPQHATGTIQYVRVDVPMIPQ